MSVIDAKDRFLGRMTPQAAESVIAQAQLNEASSWPHFEEEPVKRVIVAVLQGAVQHQQMMTLACAYSIALEVVYGA